MNPVTIVFPPVNPDLDGLACSIAYAEFLNTADRPAKPWYTGRLDGEASYALEQCPSIDFAEPSEVERATSFILVDGSELEAFPEAVNRHNVVEVVDHRTHAPAGKYFPNARINIEQVGAAATLIAEKFAQHERIPSMNSGFLLYGAIYSNTQRLIGSITTNRDAAMFKWLATKLTLSEPMLDSLLSARKSEILRDLEGAVTRESKSYFDSEGNRFVISQLELEDGDDLFMFQKASLEQGLSSLGPRAMLNLVDLSTNRSRLIVLDDAFREALELALGSFDDISQIAIPVRLRKQIVAELSRSRWPKKKITES